MSKSIKLKNNVYLSTKGIVHNRKVLADIIYPVGSIYISVNSTNPSTYYGGTWVQIKDRFLLACGSTYSNGATGGEASHTLTTNEIPSHGHTIKSTQWGYLSVMSSIDGRYGFQNGGAYMDRATAYHNDASSNKVYAENNGGSQAHNNMPPYLAVYVWKRTA